MKWFTNLMTRTKLLLGLGLIIVFLTVVIVNAYLTLTAIQASQKSLFEKEFSTSVALKDIRSNQNAIRADLLTMMQTSDPSAMDELVRDIQARDQNNQENLRNILDVNIGNAVMYQKLEDLQNIRSAFVETREQQIIPMLKDGNLKEARELALGVQSERDRKMRTLADDLVGMAESAAQTAVSASTQQARAAVRGFVSAGVIILLICWGMVLLLNHVIALPLREITGIAENIAAGDLTVNLRADDRSDEVGLLKQSFRVMVDGLRQLTSEIREGATVLAAAAGEIVATTTQVASAAAETATAVSETTSTVEEVKKTAELSSEKARYVADSAQQALQVSQAGKQAVERSIEGVGQVQRQMQVLAQSIVQLSEQSQAIGAIIATVNELAEQSNLLAVNAAIEAARAGEQGKGFGVVAQEIRNLAEQSKQATAQVRTILGDIQKATSASVLAAEQGSKAVEAGAQQTEAAGEAIQALAQSVAQAAQAAAQIAASSRQQQVGMDQVAEAMENIQQASTQNVTGTRQAETAAHNLSELGQKLKGIIGQYRV
jgi:methyl-accepting chemotaxis protein